MKQLLVMVLISGAIGWITNWVAIKMLFRPHKEINFGLFKIQGLIPKRRAEIGSGIANIIPVSYTHLTLPTIYSV